MSGTAPETPEDLLVIGGIPFRPGDRVGPYVYERLIGKGGMATVVLARDPDGQPVALKVLKASRLGTGQGRFRKEFRALARIHHPNVIRVESFGDIHGHPYIAMEYVEGQDLHQVVRQLKAAVPDTRWKQVERILVDLCRALAHIHRRGLVHRDLKPSNILLDRQGRAKLTDFGIVKDLDPGADPNVSNTLVGTWAYASPEQISGEAIDHRSDLYSLGIILFVLLTGRRPFVAKDMAGYLELHRAHEAPHPQDLDPEVPGHLDEIVERLLQKPPRDRFQSAQEVLYRLEGASADLPAPATPSLSDWEPLLVDRERETSILQEAMAALTRGQGGVTWLVGPGGMGRSRMLALGGELGRRLGFPVHHARFPGDGPFAMARLLAADLARDLGPRFPSDLGAALVASGDVQGRVRGDLRYRVMDGVRTALEQALEAGPRVLVLDDLHDAPAPALELTAFLVRTVVARGAPLLVLGTARTDPPSPSMDNLLDPAHLGTPPQVVDLRPLAPQAVEHLLRSLLGEAPGTAALAERLHRETEGNPFFLVQFLHALLERGVILRGPGGLALAVDTEEIRSGHIEIPVGVRQLLHERLAAVPPDHRVVLEVMAASGRALDLDVLLEVLDDDEDAVLDRVDELVDGGILAEHRAGSRVDLDFVHGKYGDVLYRDLAPERRVALHRQLATVLEERSAGSPGMAQVIGEHYRRAGEAGKAYLHLVVAAQRLHERSLMGEASRLVDLAQAVEESARTDLSTAAFPRIRLGLLPVRGDILYGRGAWSDAREVLVEALDAAEALGAEPEAARVRIRLSSAESRLGNDLAARQLREAALAWGRGAGDREVVADALRLMAAAAWEDGDLEACRRHTSEGLVITAEPDLAGLRAELLIAQTAVQGAQGHLSSGTAGLLEAERIFQQLGLKRPRCLALTNLCEFHTWQGQLRQAVDAADVAQGLAREILYRLGEGIAARVAGMAAHELGMADEARDRLQEALDILGPLRLRGELVATRYALGRSCLEQDQLPVAERHLSVARGLAAKGDPEGYLPLIQATWAMVLARRGDRFQAEQVLEQALRFRNAVPLPRQVQSMVVAAGAWNLLGRGPEAAQVARSAADQALSRGLRLWSLEALAVLATCGADPRERWRAREDGRRLAEEILAELPPSMARSFTLRPAVAGLLTEPRP